MKSVLKIGIFSILFVLLGCNVDNLDNDLDNQQKDPADDYKGCETAYAYFDGGCFINDGFKRWGWKIGPLSEPTEASYDIYAGAGKCDTSKGTKVGTLDVSYSNGVAEVTYNALDGYGFFETHLYVGNEEYPTLPNGKDTVAPGHYGNGDTYSDGTTGDSFEIEISGEIYIIAHAVVCEMEMPCDVDAGTIKPDADKVCVEGSPTITATPDGNAVVPDGYEVLYVLTQGEGLVIVGVNTVPEFEVNDVGTFTIHTLVYDPNTLDLSGVELGVTTGFDVYALLIDGGGEICAALDVAGASTLVEKCK